VSAKGEEGCGGWAGGVPTCLKVSRLVDQPGDDQGSFGRRVGVGEAQGGQGAGRELLGGSGGSGK